MREEIATAPAEVHQHAQVEAVHLAGERAEVLRAQIPLVIVHVDEWKFRALERVRRHDQRRDGIIGLEIHLRSRLRRDRQRAAQRQNAGGKISDAGGAEKTGGCIGRGRVRGRGRRPGGRKARRWD